MTASAAFKVIFGTSLVLFEAGWTSVAAPEEEQILHANGALPFFEVATIRPSKPNENQIMQMSSTYFIAKHISLRKLVKFAYEIPLDEQVVGGPSWIDKDFFDIDAKAERSETDSMKKLGVRVMMERSHLMLQSLLKDRFQLRLTTKTQELPAYALVVAKGGPRLKEVVVSPEVATAVKPPAPPPPPQPANGSKPGIGVAPRSTFPGIGTTGTDQITATAVRMSWLASWLLGRDEIGNRIVVDQTGLKGNYDFVLNGISVETSALPGPTTPPPDNVTTSIFTALQEQLGLKLVPTKAPAEVLVIDHVERPSEN